MERYTQTQDPEAKRLRGQFAQAAMQGLLANSMFMHGLQQRISNDDSIPDYVAAAAVEMADALLEALR